METRISPIKRDLANSSNKREFLDGSVRSFEILRNAGIGIGTYKPGWRWSKHAGPQIGKPSENHIGYVISGYFRVQDSSGSQLVIGPGEAFELAAGSDAWVEGEEACVSLDFLSFKAHSEIDT